MPSNEEKVINSGKMLIRILGYIKSGEACTIKDIIKKTKLEESTVSKYCRRLIANEDIHVSGTSTERTDCNVTRPRYVYSYGPATERMVMRVNDINLGKKSSREYQALPNGKPFVVVKKSEQTIGFKRNEFECLFFGSAV